MRYHFSVVYKHWSKLKLLFLKSFSKSDIYSIVITLVITVKSSLSQRPPLQNSNTAAQFSHHTKCLKVRMMEKSCISEFVQLPRELCSLQTVTYSAMADVDTFVNVNQQLPESLKSMYACTYNVLFYKI